MDVHSPVSSFFPAIFSSANQKERHMTRKSKTLAASTLAYLAMVAGFSAPSFIPQSPEDRPPRRDGAEWEIIRTLSPLPNVPPDTTNAFGDDHFAAELGQMLFFEKTIAGPIITVNNG